MAPPASSLAAPPRRHRGGVPPATPPASSTAGAFDEFSAAIAAALFPGDDDDHPTVVPREGFEAFQNSARFQALAERASAEMLATLLSRAASRGAGRRGRAAAAMSDPPRSRGLANVIPGLERDLLEGRGGNAVAEVLRRERRRQDESEEGMEPAAVDAAIKSDLAATAADPAVRAFLLERFKNGAAATATEDNNSNNPSSLLLNLRSSMHAVGEGDYDRCEGVGQPPLLGNGSKGEALLIAAVAATAASNAAAASAAAANNASERQLLLNNPWAPMERVVALWVGLRLGTDTIGCYQGRATVGAAASAAARRAQPPPTRAYGEPDLNRLLLSAQALDDVRSALEAMGLVHEDEDEDEQESDNHKTAARAAGAPARWSAGAGKAAVLLTRLATLVLWGEADALADWASHYGSKTTPSPPPEEMWRALDALCALARSLMANPIVGLEATDAVVLWSLRGKGGPRGGASDFLPVQAAVQAVLAAASVAEAQERAKAQARLMLGAEAAAKLVPPPAASPRAKQCLVDLAQALAAGAATAFAASLPASAAAASPSPAPTSRRLSSSSSPYSPDVVGAGHGQDLRRGASTSPGGSPTVAATETENNNPDSARLRAALKDDAPKNRAVINLASMAAQILPSVELTESPALLRRMAATAVRALFAGLSRGVVGGQEEAAPADTTAPTNASASAVGLAALRLLYLWPSFYAKTSSNPLDPQDEDGDKPRMSPDQERLGLKCWAASACRAATGFFASADNAASLAALSPATRALSASIFASGARRIVANYGHGSILEPEKGAAGMRLVPQALMDAFCAAAKNGDNPQRALWRKAASLFDADFFPENEAESRRLGRFAANADDEEFHGDLVTVLSNQMREGYCGFAPPLSEAALALDAARLAHVLAFGCDDGDEKKKSSSSSSSSFVVPLRSRLAANDARSRAEAACLINRRMLLSLPASHAVGVQTALAAALLDYRVDPLLDACVAKRALLELQPAAALIRKRVGGDGGDSGERRLARQTSAFLRMEEQVRARGGENANNNIAITLADLKTAVFEFGFIPDVLALSDVAHAIVDPSAINSGGGGQQQDDKDDLVRPQARLAPKLRRKICGFGNCSSHHEDAREKRKVCGRCKTVAYCCDGCRNTSLSRHKTCCGIIRAARQEAGTL